MITGLILATYDSGAAPRSTRVALPGVSSNLTCEGLVTVELQKSIS